MKRLVFSLTGWILLLLLPASSCEKSGEEGGHPVNPPVEETGTDIRVASFNIRFATEDDTGVKAWSARKASCRQVFAPACRRLFSCPKTLFIIYFPP